LFFDETGPATASLVTGTSSGGGEGNDTFTGVNGFDGGPYGDTLTGNATDNFIAGEDGNDTISPGDGNDYIDPGAGDDSIDGGPGTYDTVAYFSASGPVAASLATAAASGDGNDNLHERRAAPGGNDSINGGNGNDSLYGEAGNDYLDGADDRERGQPVSPRPTRPRVRGGARAPFAAASAPPSSRSLAGASRSTSRPPACVRRNPATTSRSRSWSSPGRGRTGSRSDAGTPTDHRDEPLVVRHWRRPAGSIPLTPLRLIRTRGLVF
jgi:Ca2+-binding RTX toxin-like protein